MTRACVGLSAVAPNDKMKDVLTRTISEAKSATSKVHVHTPPANQLPHVLSPSLDASNS